MKGWGSRIQATWYGLTSYNFRCYKVMQVHNVSLGPKVHVFFKQVTLIGAAYLLCIFSKHNLIVFLRHEGLY